MPTLTKEKHSWGTRLVMKPFSEPQQPTHMQIEAEVNNPPASGRRAEIRVLFHGTAVGHPLRYTDAPLWLESMRSLLSEAEKVADKMGAAEKKKKPAKKRAVKK